MPEKRSEKKKSIITVAAQRALASSLLELSLRSMALRASASAAHAVRPADLRGSSRSQGETNVMSGDALQSLESRK